MGLSIAELRRLPKPELIEDLNYEELLDDRKQQLNSTQPLLFDADKQPVFRQAELIQDGEEYYFRIPVVDDAGLLWLDLESEPSVKQLEVAAYHDMLQSQRVNNALTSNLLALSTGGHLDHLAAFYDVQRLPGETDDAFRERVQLSIRGWSPGTVEYYEFQVRSVSNQIRDVEILVPDNDSLDEKGWIYVHVMQNNATGIATEELLQEIRNHLNNKTIRLINDTFVVSSVEIVPISINAVIHLFDDALPETLSTIEANFYANFEQERRMGFSITLSWVYGLLQQPGVRKVDLNLTEDIYLSRNQAPRLQSLVLRQG